MDLARSALSLATISILLITTTHPAHAADSSPLEVHSALTAPEVPAPEVDLPDGVVMQTAEDGSEFWVDDSLRELPTTLESYVVRCASRGRDAALGYPSEQYLIDIWPAKGAQRAGADKITSMKASENLLLIGTGIVAEGPHQPHH